MKHGRLEKLTRPPESMPNMMRNADNAYDDGDVTYFWDDDDDNDKRNDCILDGSDVGTCDLGDNKNNDGR